MTLEKLDRAVEINTKRLLVAIANENFYFQDMNISFSYKEQKPGNQKEAEADIFRKELYSKAEKMRKDGL